MPSRRDRARKTLGTKISTINSGVARVANKSVPTTVGQVVTDDSLVKGAVTTDSMSPGSVDSTTFGLSAYIPSGEGAQRVPAPLTDTAYWSRVTAGDIELHKSGIHGTGTELEDIQNVEATNLGIKLVPTDDEAARIYLTGRMPVPPGRKIYATWTGDSAIDLRLVWWKQAPTFAVESVKMVSGIATLNFNTADHSFAVTDTIRVTDCGPDFDGVQKVLAVSEDQVSYVTPIDTFTANVTAADFTVANTTAVVTVDDTAGFERGGYLLLTGVGVPFDGLHSVAAIDTTANTLTFTIDYTTDTSYSSFSSALATFYVVDTSKSVNEFYLSPFGKASEDTHTYVDLHSREVWGADGITARILTRALTANVVTLTTHISTYLAVGDTVTVTNVDDVNGVAVFDAVNAVITAVEDHSHSFSYVASSTHADIPVEPVPSTVATVQTKNQFYPSHYAVYVEVPAGDPEATLNTAKVFEVLGEATTEPAYTTIERTALTDNLVTLTLANNFGFNSGSQTVVSGAGAPYDGTFEITGIGSASVIGAEITSNVVTVSATNVKAFYVGLPTVFNLSNAAYSATTPITAIGTTVNVTNSVLTNNVATLTLDAKAAGMFPPVPGASNGDTIVVAGVGAPYDGTFSVTARTDSPNTISYVVVNANVASSADTGTVTHANSLSYTKTTADAPFDSLVLGSASANTITYEVVTANVLANTNTSGTAVGYFGVEHSEITPTGMTLYNADGSISVRLSSQDINTITVGTEETGSATISDQGAGVFTELGTVDLLVSGETLLNGAVSVGGNLDVVGSFTVGGGAAGNINISGNVNATDILAANSLTVMGTLKEYSVSGETTTNVVGSFDAAKLNTVVPVSGANTNTTAYGTYTGDYLQRLARGRIYAVAWDAAPTSGTDHTFNDAYTAFASGKFYIEPGRAYLGVLSTGGIRPTVLPSAAFVFELLVSDAAFAVNATSGYRVVSSILVNSSATSTNIFAVLASGLHLQFEGVTDAQTNNWTKGKMTAVDGSNNPVPTYWMFRGRYTGGSVATTPLAIDAFAGDYQPAEFTIYDMGVAASSRAALTGTGNTVWAIGGTPSGGTTDTNTNTNTSVTTTYSTSAIIASTSSAYYDNYGIGDGGTSDPYANERSLYQGNPGTSSGTKKSQVAFSAVSSLADYTKDNFTVTKVELYLRNRHSYSAGGLTAYVGFSADAVANGSAPPAPISGAGVTSAAFTKGQGKYITLTTTQKNYFANNTARSILLGLTSASSNTYTSTTTNYGYFDGDLLSDPPKLRITYTYTVTT